MAKAYGKQEIQRIINEAYRRGYDDGKNRREGFTPAPPTVDEVIEHPLDGSDHPTAYRKRPWLDQAKGGAQS